MSIALNIHLMKSGTHFLHIRRWELRFPPITESCSDAEFPRTSQNVQLHATGNVRRRLTLALPGIL